MKYTARYFRDNHPDWKKKRDPIVLKVLYRPLSYHTASICANLGVSANAISIFSCVVGIVAAVLFMFESYCLNIIGAILINIWLLLDCTDGNVARGVKKQPFGEFADGISSYILVGLMCIGIGVSVYHFGGIFLERHSLVALLLGALASEADTLMRLIYQKYKNEARVLQEANIIEKELDKRVDHEQQTSLVVKLEMELGVSGILPLIILVATILQVLDIVLVYCFVYYVGACIISSLRYIRKALKYSENTMK